MGTYNEVRGQPALDNTYSVLLPPDACLTFDDITDQLNRQYGIKVMHDAGRATRVRSHLSSQPSHLVRVVRNMIWCGTGVACSLFPASGIPSPPNTSP